MKAKDINFSQFSSIKDFYAFIDKHYLIFERWRDVRNAWVLFRNCTLNEDEVKMAQYEIDFLAFDVRNDRLFPMISSLNDVNQIYSYPSLSEKDKELYDYLVFRSGSSENSILKARFYHILWCGPKGLKNGNYAHHAISNYIKAIFEYHKVHLDNRRDEDPVEMGMLYASLLAIHSQVKKDPADLKKITIFLLFEAENLPFYLKQGVLEKMLLYPKIFKRNDFAGTLKIFEDYFVHEKFDQDILLKTDSYILTAIQISKKLGEDLRPWYNLLGKIYRESARMEKEESRNWIVAQKYANAIEAYKMAKNPHKADEVAELYSQLKSKVKLPTFRFEITKEKFPRLFEARDISVAIANHILSHESSMEIYHRVSIGFMFPSYGATEAASKPRGNFMQFATSIYYDINKNPEKGSDRKDEAIQLMEAYALALRFSVMPFLYEIFLNGIKSGKLTFENFLIFLKDHSWLGVPYIKYDLGGREAASNWIPLIAPSIVEFFAQMDALVNCSYYRPNFVLAIESLSLKFEPIIRNLLERSGIPISTMKNKKMEELTLNNLMDLDGFKKLFDEDDQLFFTYLFSSHGGLDIRNNVAHGFFNHLNYDIGKILLLVSGLLRLARYEAKM